MVPKEKDGTTNRWVTRTDGTQLLIKDILQQLPDWVRVIEDFHSDAQRSGIADRMLRHLRSCAVPAR